MKERAMQTPTNTSTSDQMDLSAVDGAAPNRPDPKPGDPKKPQSLMEFLQELDRKDLNTMLKAAGRAEVKYDQTTGDFLADDIEGVKRIAHTFYTAGCFSHITANCGDNYEAAINRLCLVITNGRSMGLTPTAACTDTYIMNGKLCMFGDAMLAAVMRSDKCLGVPCEWDDKTKTATATARRRNADGSVTEYVQKFSMAQAEKAGYLGKSGPWKNVPERMCQWRARTWAIRDAFPDLLRGVSDIDEQRDIADEERAARQINVTAKIDALPQT